MLGDFATGGFLGALGLAALDPLRHRFQRLGGSLLVARSAQVELRHRGFEPRLGDLPLRGRTLVREILVARAVPSARRGRLIGFPTRELVQAFADRVQSILFGQVLGGDPLVRRLFGDDLVEPIGKAHACPAGRLLGDRLGRTFDAHHVPGRGLSHCFNRRRIAPTSRLRLKGARGMMFRPS